MTSLASCALFIDPLDLLGLVQVPDADLEDGDHGETQSVATSATKHHAKEFFLQFEQGTGASCRPLDVLIVWLVPLAVLCGLLGAAFNRSVIHLNESRKRLYQRFGATLDAKASP